MIIIALLLGAAGAALFVHLGRKRPRAAKLRLYANALVVAALFYIAFSLLAGAGLRALALESLGVVIYGAAAWAGLRGRPSVLAAGWALHVVWDISLHLRGLGAVYTPAWYPWACVTFDLIIAGSVMSSASNVKPMSGAEIT